MSRDINELEEALFRVWQRKRTKNWNYDKKQKVLTRWHQEWFTSRGLIVEKIAMWWTTHHQGQTSLFIRTLANVCVFHWTSFILTPIVLLNLTRTVPGSGDRVTSENTWISGNQLFNILAEEKGKQCESHNNKCNWEKIKREKDLHGHSKTCHGDGKQSNSCQALE